MSGHAADAPIVIIGGGQAGDEAAFQLRQLGAAGPIVLIAEEPFLPYRRPPLSKTYLTGEAEIGTLFLRTPETYARADITFRTGRRVVLVDRTNGAVRLDDGSVVAYRKLILAVGGTPRHLAVPGAAEAGIHYLRTIDDAQALQGAMQPGRRLLIVGGGYVGLEVAAVAVKRGLRVTVLEAAPRLLARVASAEISAFYDQVHRDAGVDIHTGASVSGFVRDGNGVSVACGHVRYDADIIVAGIGLVPNTELAEHAGLLIDNGILVDSGCHTSDPDIFAIGDCSVHAEHDFLGTQVRLESVPNAIEQAKKAAAAICGKPIPRAAPPWFWSEQYDLNLQMVGLIAGYDRCVLRGDPRSRSFSAFYVQEGRVIAADSVNRPQDFMAAKRMVAGRMHVEADRLGDEAVPLKQLLTQTA
jgi:3-phenylpropionate/trans-cinnamate dioxygenase ferredoxin reductase subunit